MKQNKKGYLTIPKEADELDVVFTYKGNPCPYLCPTGEEVTELESWLLFRSDLNCALESLKHILYIESKPTIFPSSESISRGLLFSSIVSYAKCFAQARGRVVRLEKEHVFEGEAELLKTHNQVLKMRNKFVAHGDKSEFEHVMVRIALTPEPFSKEVLTPYSLVASVASLSKDTIKDYIKMASYVGSFIELKIDKLNDFLKTELALMDLDEVYSYAEPPRKVQA